MTTEPIADKESWRGRPVEDRQYHMACEFLVPHPSYMRIVNEVKRMASRCQNEKKGHAILVLACSGGGKTHLVNTLMKRWPRDDSGEVSSVPVVAFSIPSTPTQKAMCSELLETLGDPKSDYGSARTLFKRAIKLLKKVGTIIIFIDNVHDIPEQRRGGGVKQIGNWIRDLIERGKCLVVMLGTHAARQMTEGNAQLRRRGAKHMVMPPFDCEPAEAMARLRRFLHETDKRLPLAEMSNLDHPALARKIFWATYGVVDYIFQILTEAVRIAVDDARERLVEGDLEMAFDAVFQDSVIGLNPFSKEGPARPLDEPGEPFHDWYDSSNPNPRAWQAKQSKK